MCISLRCCFLGHLSLTLGTTRANTHARPFPSPSSTPHCHHLSSVVLIVSNTRQALNETRRYRKRYQRRVTRARPLLRPEPLVCQCLSPRLTRRTSFPAAFNAHHRWVATCDGCCAYLRQREVSGRDYSRKYSGQEAGCCRDASTVRRSLSNRARHIQQHDLPSSGIIHYHAERNARQNTG